MIRCGQVLSRVTLIARRDSRNEEIRMPYMIKTLGKPGSEALRMSLRPAHLEYLKSRQSLILAAGALLEDDGSGGNGGLMILDTEDRAVAEAFIAADPFTTGGLFASIEVTRWRKAFFNFDCLL